MEFVSGSFDAEQVLAIRDGLRGQYPRVQLLPVLPPHPPLGLSGSFVGLSVGAAPNRWWFISEDDSHLVQIQHDRLVLNWRQTHKQPGYPRHHSLLPTFFEVLAIVDTTLGRITPTSLETDYYNLDAGLPDGSGLAELITGAARPPEPLLDDGRVVQQEIVEHGRVHGRNTRWNLTAHREADGPARFHIGARADAAGLSTTDTDSLEKAYESLHGLAIEGFERHLTAAARERWR